MISTWDTSECLLWLLFRGPPRVIIGRGLGEHIDIHVTQDMIICLSSDIYPSWSHISQIIRLLGLDITLP